jgi:ribonuclease III
LDSFFHRYQVNKASDWAAEALGHRFTDETLLATALTHSSAAGATYERLEFLGDRVLGLVIADWLYREFPQESEGKLNRRMSDLVRRETCATVARNIGAASHINLERAARASGVQDSENALGDVCEALIAALYLDGGMDAPTRFIQDHWRLLISAVESASKDPKSALQEWAQGRGLPLPTYQMVGQSGPDHAPLFDIEVQVPGHDPVIASAPSKQEAQKRAAADLLARLEKKS